MRKNAASLFRHVYLSFKEESSGRDHYTKLFVLLAVVLLELANGEVVVDLIRLVLALQDLALSNQESLSVYNRCGVHSVCVVFMSVVCQLGPPPALRAVVSQVVENRKRSAPYLLPDSLFSESPSLPEAELTVEEACLFVQSELTEALTGSSYGSYSERFNCPYTPQLTDEERVSRRMSVGDVVSLQMDLGLDSESDSTQRPEAEHITFQTLKNTIEDRGSLEEEQRRRREVMERFQTAPFEEIAAHCGNKTLLQSRLQQVFDLIIRPPPSPSTPVYDIHYPDLCVY